MNWRTLVPLLLLACKAPGGGDTDGAGNGDSGTVGDAPHIDAVDPAWDTTLGGAEITLTGSFQAGVSVRVGGVEAEVRSAQPSSGTLVFYAPPAEFPGTVAVMIDDPGGTATLPDGFTYYQESSGKAGLVGTLLWLQQVGGYWGSDPVSSGYAYLAPVEPLAYDWPLRFAPAIDTCASDQSYAYAPTLTALDPGRGSTVTLSGAAGALDLPWDPATLQFVKDDLTDAALPPASDYALSGFTLANPAFPDYSLPLLTGIPDSFAVTNPAISGDTPPRVSESFDVTWGGGTAGDGVFLTLHLYTEDQKAYQETVTCQVTDDGAFTVPAGLWSTGWVSGRQLDLFVTRWRGSDATVPYTGADVAVIGEHQLYGAAFTK